VTRNSQQCTVPPPFPKGANIGNCSQSIVDVALSRSRESFEMIQRHR
jgi:hypothetical protein